MTTDIDLLALFDSLKKPESGLGAGLYFSVAPVPNHSNIKLGKDSYGAPSVLIHTRMGSAGKVISSISLEHVSIQYNLECRVYHSSGGVEEDTFTVILCRDTDRLLNEYFLRVIVSALGALGENPPEYEISNAIEQLAELFRALTQPPKKSVQGLWAELFIIFRSNNPLLMIDAWHTTPEDRYDFCSGNLRLEVKSTSHRIRRHHFSLEQLQPPLGANLLIVSMFVERAGGGVSIMDIVKRNRSRIQKDSSAVIRLDTVIAKTLGNNWKNSFDERFDFELAEKSLAFYESNDVPTLSNDLPMGVSNVNFVSDLTGKPTANIIKNRTLGGLFEVALSNIRK